MSNTPTYRMAALGCAALCCAVVGPLACPSLATAETLVYDLTFDGPETSVVEECIAENNCFSYPITGRIEVILGDEAPLLTNIDSQILLPPDVHPPISPEIWDYLNLLEGQYLPPPAEGVVAMQFRPGPLALMRPYELHVELTDDRQTLAITGGIEQDAASPLEPDVRFRVHGELLPTSDGTGNLPEPHAGLLMLLALPWLNASRRRR